MSATSTPGEDGLNPFPGYPVVSISGDPDRTVVTSEIGESRDIVREHVKRWRVAAVDKEDTTPKPVEWSFVVLVSGDYGTGKTHLLIDSANFLKEQFARRAIRETVVVRVPALGAAPSRWYRELLGVALDNHGERNADGGFFTRLVLQVYSIAAKSLLANDAIKTDSLNDQPAVAIRLVNEGLLNATSVWNAFQAILRRCCTRAPDTVLSHFAVLMETSSRAASERWLAGGDGDAGANPPSDQEAAGILSATAALCGVARWPFALFIDEIEQFLREDDRSGSEVNTTWLKRLLGDLAEAGAFVAIGGHVSAWERRRDFLDRFSGGASRIDMKRLEGSDVLALVAARVGPRTKLDLKQAELIADLCKGNMRRILSLCRLLYDRSRKFTAPLTEQDIGDCVSELGHALTRDQALLNIREAFETRGHAVRQEMKEGGARFDLVARAGSGSVFVVIVRSTPEVKEAQDLAIQFVRQVNANRHPGERAHAFFVCDTPEDVGVRKAVQDWPDVAFTWFNYTNLDTFSAIRQTIDRDSGGPSLIGPAPGPAPNFTGQFEAAMNRRLDELDRQRTSELRALHERLADSERRAAALESSARVAEPSTPSAPLSSTGPSIQFSAADLLAKPGVELRLRALMSSSSSWIELILLALGLFVAIMSSRLPDLWLHAPTRNGGLSFEEYERALDAYTSAVNIQSFCFFVGGLATAVVAALLLLRRYLAVESYFDYANQLIKEEYLAAPHPWLLAGANRIVRRLALVYGPTEGMERLQKELDDLVGRRTAVPSQGMVDRPSATIEALQNQGTSSPTAPTPIPASTQAPHAKTSDQQSSARFEACMPFIFKADGGYSDNPADPGGPINFGITLANLKAYEGNPNLTAEDVKKLTSATAREIYRSNYWNRMQCGALPAGLDLQVFDFGVNAGPGEAVKTLQKIVGVTADGSIGPITLAALGQLKPRDLISQYSQARLAFYQGLNHPQFEQGWATRVAQIQTAASQMLETSQAA